MNLLIVLVLVLVIILISDSAKKKAALKKYHTNNNASFVAEVEEFARWGELVFREYCNLVGMNSALSELKRGIELHKSDNGFIMPKICVKRRSCLGFKFRSVFEQFRNANAIEILQARYSLPTAEVLQYDEAVRKSYRVWGGGSISGNYYGSLYQIIYLNVYRSLCNRQYNIGKNGIKEDEITEHKRIQEVIIPYPWLSGEFKRY